MSSILDTNILLVSIPTKSPYRKIFDNVLSGKILLLISNDILSEYEEILSKKSNVAVAKNVIELFLSLKNVEFVEPFYKWNLIQRDKDDNKFVDCAIAGNADYIVSNDRHFHSLKNINFPIVPVINLEKFLKLL